MNKHENLIKNLGNPQNWFYCGDNQSPEGKKYYKKKIGHTIFPHSRADERHRDHEAPSPQLHWRQLLLQE